jgi:hypothetical protein
LLAAFKKRYGADSHLVMLGYFGSYARNRAISDSHGNVVFDTDAPTYL